jgi:hypothetical protein
MSKSRVTPADMVAWTRIQNLNGVKITAREAETHEQPTDDSPVVSKQRRGHVDMVAEGTQILSGIVGDEEWYCFRPEKGGKEQYVRASEAQLFKPSTTTTTTVN